MSRKKYSCDFETTTDPMDCRVWGYGYMNIYNTKEYGIGNNIDDFMDWAEKTHADLYFHNLKFDGSFIINWLLSNGFRWSDKGEEKTFNTLISKLGQWYMIDITYGYKGKRKIHTRIYDSLKKLPFKVKKIGQDFHLDVAKGDIDYHKDRPVGYEITDLEKEYIKNDIEIIAQALRQQFNEGLKKMTNGSDALNSYKETITKANFEKLFPVLNYETDKNIRLAYKGGFTWLNEKYKGEDIDGGLVFDVNSLYPSQMYDKELPYGYPLFFEGEYEKDNRYPLYIQHIRCSFELKEGYIPTIQIKQGMMFAQNEYLHSSDYAIVDLYVTNVDLDLIKKHYNLYDLEYVSGYKFRSTKGLFKNYIDKWLYVKNTESGAKRLIAKLMLNSLYGKFASNPDVTGKVPYLKDDGSLGFHLGDDDIKDSIYTPMAAFITAYSRQLTISTAQSLYDRIIYCDTDSIHLVGTSIPKEIEHIIDDKKLGYWQHESTFTKGRYLRQKTYCLVIDGELKVTSAGMGEDVKKKVTWDNFHIGFQADGNLKQRQVKGGVVLENSPFAIK